MRVALLARDLIIASKISEAAARAGAVLGRFENPADLPPASDLDVLLVDWGDRNVDWGERLVGWCAQTPESPTARVVLFGPHTDLAAHAEARAIGLGPMWARSKLVAELPALMAGDGQ